MVGLGTLINMAAIAAGGTAGLVFRRYLSKSLQTNLMSVMGLVCMFLGTAGTLSLMLRVSGTGPALTSTGSMMMVISFTVGTLIGTILKLEDRFEGFGLWLQRKAGRTGDNGFIGAFVTASLTVCIGAMAVIGSIQDGIAGDYTVLAAKAVLDCVIILIMTSALGIGCVFSAIPVGIFQGLVTLFAFLIGPLLSQASIDADRTHGLDDDFRGRREPRLGEEILGREHAPHPHLRRPLARLPLESERNQSFEFLRTGIKTSPSFHHDDRNPLRSPL